MSIQVKPNTLNLSFPGISGADLLAAAPEIAASTGDRPVMPKNGRGAASATACCACLSVWKTRRI
jgi:hypothetical protein